MNLRCKNKIIYLNSLLKLFCTFVLLYGKHLVREMAMAYVSIGTVFMILTAYLNISNVYAPLMLMLKDSEKERRARDSKSFLKHYEVH